MSEEVCDPNHVNFEANCSQHLTDSILCAFIYPAILKEQHSPHGKSSILHLHSLFKELK